MILLLRSLAGHDGLRILEHAEIRRLGEALSVHILICFFRASHGGLLQSFAAICARQVGRRCSKDVEIDHRHTPAVLVLKALSALYQLQALEGADLVAIGSYCSCSIRNGLDFRHSQLLLLVTTILIIILHQDAFGFSTSYDLALAGPHV